MPDYNSVFGDHVLHETLSGVIGLIEKAEELEDPEAVSYVARIGEVLRALGSQLETADPVFVSIAQLDQLNKTTIRINTELQIYLNSKVLRHARNADSHTDVLLVQMAPLRVAQAPESIGAAEEDLQQYRSHSRAFIAQLSDERSRNLTDVRENTESLKSNIDTLQDLVAQQMAEIERQKGRLDSAIEGFQKQFSDDQQSRNNEHLGSQKERDGQFQDTAATRKVTWEALDEETRRTGKETGAELRTSAAETVSFLETKKKEASSLLKVTANIAVTGNYNKMANSDRRWSHGWRLTATLLMLGAILFAWKAIEVALAAEDGYDIKAVLLRVGVAIVVSGPAVYAAREAEKHRKSERQYRQMELELASIDPYIESLPEVDRTQLKKELANRLFARSDNLVEHSDETVGFLRDLVGSGWKAFLEKMN